MQTSADIHALSARAFMDESTAMVALLAQVEKTRAMENAIMRRALGWAKHIRSHGAGSGVESFLSAYALSTEEGAALMSLAEALLRIPDAATADHLIQSTLEGHRWEQPDGGPIPWQVHLSGWGLFLTGRILDFGHEAPGLLRGAVARLGDPLIREALKRAMRLIGRQFVLGETIADALAHAKPYQNLGYRFSFDMLGEGARSDAVAQAYVQSYLDCIRHIGETIIPGAELFAAPGISVKLSALHPRYSLTQLDRAEKELLPRLTSILLAARQAGIAVAIDAEESARLDIELRLFERLLEDEAFAGWDGIGFVLQAYQKRAFYIVDWLAELAQKHKRIIPLRLVKGAYWDSEIKWAQIAGLPGYPVFTRKELTDISYLACADKILARREAFYPQFATHNARTAASIVALAQHYGWAAGSYEFQRLHGMGEALHGLILSEFPSRIYAPVGPHKDLLAYLIRRLLENGANSSFVHLLMDENKSEEEILADPVAQSYSAYQPIPLPRDLYGAARKNSQGVDFGKLAQLSALEKSLPPVSVDSLAPLSAEALQSSIAAAHRAFEPWSRTPVETRAAILERAADLLEARLAELVALCADEGGKTLADGVSEVREAADYCRYYAAEARRLTVPQTLAGPTGEHNQLSLHPRGVFACISPWNFPLAIFIGQVSAALASGNCVVAKPAAQTPRIAKRAVELLHEAGIPADVLHLAHGPASVIGDALTSDPRIAGIVFTGSGDTARHIQKIIGARSGALIPFIAETGGQNAMIVDSSALPEQAVDDIILSAFGSAGQRCSALRVLFLQEDIAETFLPLLAGAMQQLRLGNPRDPATDIGPVIDARAQAALLSHIDTMTKQARLIASAPPTQTEGNFVPPHAFEIGSIGDVPGEIFGPILHVVRFRAEALDKVCAAINATGYGLTFGIHSRIENHINYAVSHVRAGNIYVNRSMIGATVGVQPFGGENLSGTGPKAGGPHYLLRFMTERTVTVNTAAIGGNISLLSGP